MVERECGVTVVAERIMVARDDRGEVVHASLVVQDVALEDKLNTNVPVYLVTSPCIAVIMFCLAALISNASFPCICAVVVAFKVALSIRSQKGSVPMSPNVVPGTPMNCLFISIQSFACFFVLRASCSVMCFVISFEAEFRYFCRNGQWHV